MSDLISRQAAIDAIERLILPQVKGETAAEEINRVAWRCAINCAEEMIGHLPSAERRGRWIPVTERLPAYGEEVLLSMNGDCGIGYLVPTYDERRYEWHHLGWFYFFNEVDAWMPLPTPYKGGEEE